MRAILGLYIYIYIYMYRGIWGSIRILAQQWTNQVEKQMAQTTVTKTVHTSEGEIGIM